ncbi:MAG: AmmeMemoRadiSam system radical SAM enzyme [Calditrichia bacterium]
MKEAFFYEQQDSERLKCFLCPRYCLIKPGQRGFCYVRKNIGGRLIALSYNRPYAINVDPVEKKPLYHFLPGTQILSIGTAGCNLACKFCQNWELCKAEEHSRKSMEIPPERVVQMGFHYDTASIAFTYNEPTVFAEYAMDISGLARKHHIRSVMVSNGYITPEAIDSVYADIDAANIDLKAFTDRFYQKYTLSYLEPVLFTLKRLQELGVWIEITNLVIPGLNDDEKELTRLCEWVISELGPDVPLHFTAFHPDYKLKDRHSTTPSSLIRIRKQAQEIGLNYVYLGNISDGEGSDTYCPQCSNVLVQRSWYSVKIKNFKNGHCTNCGREIPGIFS